MPSREELHYYLQELSFCRACKEIVLDLLSDGAETSRRPRPRIQTLSDLIFGLALSIGAASLLAGRPANLTALATSLELFGFSFLILAVVWVRYTKIMSALPVDTPNISVFNFALLFLVSIEPYLFNLINTQPVPGQIDASTVTQVYAIDIGFMNLILAYFTHLLTIEEKKLIADNLLKSYRLHRNLLIGNASLFLISAIPMFTLEERFVIWVISFLTIFVRVVIERGSNLSRIGL